MKYFEAFKTLILAATLSGVYFPSIEKIYGEKPSVKLLKFLCIFPGIALPVYVISMLKYQIFDADEVGNKIYGGTIILISGIMVFTFYAFCYYRNDFERLFQLWDSMFQEELYPKDREELLAKNRRMPYKWLTRCASISVLSSVMYCTAVYFNSNKRVNHPTGIPYRSQSPDFELINTLDLIITTFGFANLVSFDSMTMTFLTLEEAQLTHLKRSLGKIVDILSVTDDGQLWVKSDDLSYTYSKEWKIKMASEVVDKKMRIWLSHHHQVIRFHKEFQKVFFVPLCAKFFVFVLMICFIFFLILAGKFSILELIFANAFCFILYAVFYANVMVADSILEVASTIFVEAFGKSWYLYPKNLRDAFLIIQMNSHRPLQYTAFKKYALSSRNFLKILSSAYSLFTFMLQTNRKKIKTLEIRTSRQL